MDDEIWVYCLELVLITISSIGCLILITKYSLFNHSRTYSFELVNYLCISTLLLGMSYLINFKSRNDKVINTICIIQGFLIIWFELSQVIVATYITLYVYNSVNNYYHDYEMTKRQRIILIMLGFILPIIPPLIALSLQYIGPSCYWCWISEHANVGVDLFATFYYLFVWAFLIFNIYLFVKIIRTKINLFEQDMRNVSYFIKSMILFPFIGLFGWFFPTIWKFFNFLGDDVYFLRIAGIVFFHVKGIAYAFIFLIDSLNIKKRIRDTSKTFNSVNSRYSQSLTL
jgi:hypothetical protein